MLLENNKLYILKDFLEFPLLWVSCSFQRCPQIPAVSASTLLPSSHNLITLVLWFPTPFCISVCYPFYWKRLFYFHFTVRFMHPSTLSYLAILGLFVVAWFFLRANIYLWVNTSHVCLFWVWVTSLCITFSGYVHLQANSLMSFFVTTE